MPPRITIVTPSLNQVAFLERTIRSVVEQGYPDLEYLVFDGGSTDGTVEFMQGQGIRVHSQSGRGYGQGMLQGLQGARGDIVGEFTPDGAIHATCSPDDPAAGPDAALRILPVDPDSRVPERRLALTPWDP